MESRQSASRLVRRDSRISLINAPRTLTVLHHCRRSCLNYHDLYSHRQIHGCTHVKFPGDSNPRCLSRNESLVFSLEKLLVRPSSFQSILIFARDAVSFLRRGPSLCSCLCYVIIVRAPKRTAGHIPGHGRSRITYISPAIRRRARIQARIESGWNNSRAGDDNLAKRRWTSINRARFIYRRRCGKQRFPGSLPVRIYRKHGNCWSWPFRSRKIPCHFRPPPPPPDYSRRWIIVARPENFRVSPESQDTGMQLDSGTMAKSDSAVGKLLENFLDENI